MKSEDYEKTRAQILPFIHLDLSNPNTICTALWFAKNQCELHGIKTCFFIFDQRYAQRHSKLLPHLHI